MRSHLVVVSVAASLLVAACGGSSTSAPGDTTTTQVTSTTAAVTSTTAVAVETTQPARAVDPAAFCQATTELNTTLLLSAFSDLAGEGSQDLFLLAKLPELKGVAAVIAETAPDEYAAAAATLSRLYDGATKLAAERGLAVADLEAVAADIEAESLTIDQLYSELGIEPADVSAIFEDAAAALSDMEPPTALFGASPSDLGCPEPELAMSACELLDAEQLTPILGEDYTAEPEEIPDLGEQCTFKGDGGRSVYVVLAGPSYYLPAAWNEITEVDGVGDEAFLTTGLSSPFLYAKRGNTVVSVAVYNVDPAPTVDELADLARIVLTRAGG